MKEQKIADWLNQPRTHLTIQKINKILKQKNFAFFYSPSHFTKPFHFLWRVSLTGKLWRNSINQCPAGSCSLFPIGMEGVLFVWVCDCPETVSLSLLTFPLLPCWGLAWSWDLVRAREGFLSEGRARSKHLSIIS